MTGCVTKKCRGKKVIEIGKLSKVSEKLFSELTLVGKLCTKFA